MKNILFLSLIIYLFPVYISTDCESFKIQDVGYCNQTMVSMISNSIISSCNQSYNDTALMSIILQTGKLIS